MGCAVVGRTIQGASVLITAHICGGVATLAAKVELLAAAPG